MHHNFIRYRARSNEVPKYIPVYNATAPENCRNRPAMSFLFQKTIDKTFLAISFSVLLENIIPSQSSAEVPLSYFNSPRSKVRSEEPDRTVMLLAEPPICFSCKHLLIGSDDGDNSAQLTVPLWPGNLYNSLPVSLFQTTAVPSPAPAAILFPSEFQLALMRFFSIPAGAPSNIRMCRSVGANGLMSQVRTVESIELDSSICESGEIRRDEMVSVCPSIE